MTDISIAEQAGVFFPGVQLKAVGLVIDSLDQHQWKECGAFLSHLNGATMFWLGDWANYAETTWGDKYTELIEQTGYNHQTLRDAAWVCNAVALSRRKDKLTFAHHKEVAHLEPAAQTKWLSTAERETLTTRELRASVKAGKIVRDSAATVAKAIGMDSIEALPPLFNRIYSKTFKGEDIAGCDSTERLTRWIECTQPMVDANRKARVRLALLDGSR
jgi:hypothetical protein